MCNAPFFLPQFFLNREALLFTFALSPSQTFACFTALRASLICQHSASYKRGNGNSTRMVLPARLVVRN
jgi:hypothetical protein